jgi:hypothetical protein
MVGGARFLWRQICHYVSHTTAITERKKKRGPLYIDSGVRDASIDAAKTQ